MNGRFLRPFFWSALPFGVVMTGIELLIAGSGLSTALLTGGLSGATFGGAMGALNASAWIRDWARRKTHPSLDEGEVVRESGFVTRRENRGLLYLTNQKLRFSSHPLNFGTTTWAVPLSDVQEAVPSRTLGGLIPNGVVVRMASGEEEMLTTWEREEWCRLINEHAQS